MASESQRSEWKHVRARRDAHLVRPHEHDAFRLLQDPGRYHDVRRAPLRVGALGQHVDGAKHAALEREHLVHVVREVPHGEREDDTRGREKSRGGGARERRRVRAGTARGAESSPAFRPRSVAFSSSPVSHKIHYHKDPLQQMDSRTRYIYE